MKSFELAETVGISAADLQEMVDQGMPCEADGEFQLDDVLAWMAAHSRGRSGQDAETAEAVKHAFDP